MLNREIPSPFFPEIRTFVEKKVDVIIEIQMSYNRHTYPRYSMHKYWGKKPANGLSSLIDTYTSKDDIVIDPFAGYGVFCCEAYLKGRNIIANDLNPIANFINKNLLCPSVSIEQVKSDWEKIKMDFIPFVEEWYQVDIDGVTYYPISVLRNKDNIPIKFTYKDNKQTKIKDIPQSCARKFIRYESEYHIDDWYPSDSLIENSRISAHLGMTICDLFTKRALACHARLYSLILKHSKGEERDLLLFAFTANLANCSKLVPPIKSRGALSQGAWMTGFYVGSTYVENNVLHYFENRLKKAIKGKEDFFRASREYKTHESHSTRYKITNEDAKHLSLPNCSVDYVFTDLPYGDSVPYFEQSVIWNSWLKLSADYKNEIVISDSHNRAKNIEEFEKDINSSISEIHRILKDEKYFSLTFHSLSGLEWRAVTNACILNNFCVVEYKWLEQKTYPPRQLNRLKSIKGDVLVTFQKKSGAARIQLCDDKRFMGLTINFIRTQIELGLKSTNEIMMAVMEWILLEKIIIGDVDVFKILNENFRIDQNGEWCIQ
jgi:hypothetical protein